MVHTGLCVVHDVECSFAPVKLHCSHRSCKLQHPLCLLQAGCCIGDVQYWHRGWGRWGLGCWCVCSNPLCSIWWANCNNNGMAVSANAITHCCLINTQCCSVCAVAVPPKILPALCMLRAVLWTLTYHCCSEPMNLHGDCTRPADPLSG